MQPYNTYGHNVSTLKSFFYNIKGVFLHVFAFSIADLSKHKRYEIRLSVYNAVGEGPISTPQEVFVGEAGECLSLQTRTSTLSPPQE